LSPAIHYLSVSNALHWVVLGSGAVFGELMAFDGEDFDRYALRSRYARQEQSLPMNDSDL